MFCSCANLSISEENMKRYILAFLLLVTGFAAAQTTSADQDAYCAYTQRVADAQKIYLRSPQLENGVTQQPINSSTPQAYSGIVNSVTDDLKARLVGKAAGKNCGLYRATVDAQHR